MASSLPLARPGELRLAHRKHEKTKSRKNAFAGFAQKRCIIVAETIRKAGRQEECGFDFSCFPAFLILNWDSSFCAKPLLGFFRDFVFSRFRDSYLGFAPKNLRGSRRSCL
jgi:hypothetical protein